jgi:hypothetical protein
MRRLIVGVVLGLMGCGARGSLPASVTCARWTQASGDAALAQALSAATSGTCVVAQAGTYRQALSVPQGVALVAETGGAVELGGGSEAVPVVSLAPNAVLAGVKVSATSADIGISGAGKGARLFQVSVSGGKKAGVVFWCEEDCRTDDFSEVSESTITGAAVGLVTNGVRVRLKNGAVSKSTGGSLRAGYGVVAAAGAVLEVEGTTIDQNELGVLLDGAGATEASLTNVSVKDNTGRGIWAQGLSGSMASPKLKLVNPTIERNVLVGLGVRGSLGVSVTGGRIAGTLTGPAMGQSGGQVVMVGDGVGAFEGTGDARLDGVVLEANQRSQALVDSAGAGIVFAASVNVTPGSALGLVVQRTTPTVEAMNATRPAVGMELSVSAPTLGLPTRWGVTRSRGASSPAGAALRRAARRPSAAARSRGWRSRPSAARAARSR